MNIDNAHAFNILQQEFAGNHIDLYNAKVLAYLQANPLTPIQQHAIKHFKDNADRNKLSIEDYNKQVEIFNRSGLILRKKAVNYSHPKIDSNYSYINYPMIDREAYHETMKNYRQQKNEYNIQVAAYNKLVNGYNLAHNPKEAKKYASEISAFKEINNSLFTNQYNKQVVAFNEKVGFVCIKQRTKQTIKDATELFFSVIVGFYAKQLKKYNKALEQTGQSTRIAKNNLKALEIDHYKLANHNIDGITRLTSCKRTAQNHIKRLREAGILTNYFYSGQKKAIKVHLNPKILVVFDGKTPKKQNIENERFTPIESKDLHDNSDSTRTLLKEKEKKSNVFNIGSLITDLMPQSDVFYKNTSSNKNPLDEKANQGPPKNANINRKISENARKIIIDDRQLAENLFKKVYEKYEVLRFDRLLQLEMYSDLSNEEFKTLLVQDIVKQSYKIWKNHNVFQGEWKRTINRLNEILFKNIETKEMMLQKLKEYRWKINFARQWFLKNQPNALFPYQYFDPTRKNTNEIGFSGLHFAWKSHLKYNELKAKKLQNEKIEAKKRQRRLSDVKKMNNILQKFYTGKINFNKMYDYINQNLPPIFLQDFERLFKEYNKITA